MMMLGLSSTISWYNLEADFGYFGGGAKSVTFSANQLFEAHYKGLAHS